MFTGKTLDAGERLIWKRWLESQNQKHGRRSRLRAPCCGKSTFRFRLVPDDEGYYYCKQCWDSAWQAQWHIEQPQLMQEAAAQDNEPGLKREPPPPWRQMARKKSRDASVLTAEEMNELLLGLETAVA